MFAFRDRFDAGRRLASQLSKYRDQPNLMVLALPRGGVPVGYEVAQALHAPLDIIVVRKLGFPGNPELAIGAIAGGGIRVLSPQVLASLHIPGSTIEAIIDHEEVELQRREALYRKGRPPLELCDKTVLLIDDGVATGSTMMAAIRVLRAEGAGKIIVAIPVATRMTSERLGKIADQCVCLLKPEEFAAIGEWYEDFSQLTDRDVVRLLEQSAIREAEHAQKVSA